MFKCTVHEVFSKLLKKKISDSVTAKLRIFRLVSEISFSLYYVISSHVL